MVSVEEKLRRLLVSTPRRVSVGAIRGSIFNSEGKFPRSCPSSAPLRGQDSPLPCATSTLNAQNTLPHYRCTCTAASCPLNLAVLHLMLMLFGKFLNDDEG